MGRGDGSGRIVSADGADDTGTRILHVDMDAFYASVEVLDDPSLAGKPLIVGGMEGRGVVSSASYEARRFGVRSAMGVAQALRLCPQAVVVPPHFERYAALSRQVMSIFHDITPLVEPLSIDEAFLDLSGTEKLHRASPALTLARFARAVEREVGITVSVGLAANKFLAKIASDLDKPRGFSVIGRSEAAAFLAPRPVTTIWGVGRAFSERLAADGYRTVGDLQQADPARLAGRYGALGLRIARLATGEDSRPVVPNTKRKSVGSEVTFFEDLAALGDLRPILREQAERVSWGLKHEDIAGITVTLKLKTADFKLRTRARRLNDPTQLADRIFATVDALLAEEAHGQKYRLIGVTVGGLCDSRLADPADLVDEKAARKAAAERAMDEVRQKFGKRALETGLVFDDHRRRGK